MRRNHELEAFLDSRGRRIWAATESRAIGYGGDALVSDATGLSRPTIRAGRRELESGGAEFGWVRRPGAGRPGIEQSQPGIKQALEKLVDPLTRGNPESPLRWTCKSRAQLTAALSKAGWKVSSTTVSGTTTTRGPSSGTSSTGSAPYTGPTPGRASRQPAMGSNRNRTGPSTTHRAARFDSHRHGRTMNAGGTPSPRAPRAGDQQAPDHYLAPPKADLRGSKVAEIRFRLVLEVTV